MSPEAQKIAIAETCGWKNCEIRNNPMDGKKDWLSGIHPRLQIAQSIPDYVGNLNAMAEAEVHLLMSGPGSGPYQQELESVCKRNGNIPVFATAPERAEAFLRTVGKWTT